jgi:methyl-accepting chemotaxis protein
LGVFAAQNSTSDFNVAVGGFSLRATTAGTRNTAVGAGAMESGDAGNDNTAVGELAGNNISGNSNTCLGSSAGANQTNGEGGIYIGAQVPAGTPGEFEFIRIGNDTAFTFPYDTFIAGIYGRSAGPSPLTVMCGSDGKLSANASSRRFKHDIKPIDNASDAILALKPVSFRYNNDSTDTPWFGLIAEDVAQVNENLIVRDKEGKPFGVRYDQVNAMLLNEFIKEHKKVEEQQASISQLKSEMQTMVAQLKEQAAQIQKVSAQLEVTKPAPQVVANKP